MITIDGSEGEGGGQVLRNACALSLITGQPFTIENIRGKRSKPGLMRQHLTAIEAACTIGASECEGLEIGSSAITFRPGMVTPGEYRFAVGTAGSTGLVLQTVLMPLLAAGGPSRLVLEGGTHNMMAPPYDFIAKAFLPQIERMGPRLSARLTRHGFFPRGGGRIEIDIEPAPLTPVDGLERGELREQSATAVFAALDPGIAERIVKTARKVLSGWPEVTFAVRKLPDEQGPGIVLLLEAAYENVTEVVAGFGKLGLSAERVGGTAARRMAGYMASAAFAGPYLQDQLLLPYALAGEGRLSTVKLSQHTRTAAEVITRFTGTAFRFTDREDGTHLVEIVR